MLSLVAVAYKLVYGISSIRIRSFHFESKTFTYKLIVCFFSKHLANEIKNTIFGRYLNKGGVADFETMIYLLWSWALRIGFGTKPYAEQLLSIYISMICFLIRKEQKKKKIELIKKNECVLYDGLTWNIQASVISMMFWEISYSGGGGGWWFSDHLLEALCH